MDITISMPDSVRHVLLVDRDPVAVAHATAALQGVDLETVATPPAALDRVVGSAFDAVLFDPALAEDEDAALAILHRMRTVAPDPVVVMWAANPSVEFTVRAMRAGSIDVLRKSSDVVEVRSVVERAMSHGALAREVRRLRNEVERVGGLGEVIGESPLMRGLAAMIERVAASDATVLIVGESGTGKELLARTIHRVGPRADGPFVAFDCSALAPSLLEAELFGHEKGAFTGAARARRGLFREANGGTIFLDEIGDIDASVQNKLLRVLQEREIKPVGGDRAVPIDVRVVAATTRTSICTGRSPPTGLISRSWSTRRSLFWTEASMSPISSRKIVPPLASRNRPRRARAAPVNAPFS
jgi:DNA-binding NtrC family response regulator